MKRMECEICGSNNLIKTEENVFECQACGCKYTLEQAKSLLQEITGTVSVSNIASAENLLLRARRFLDDLDFDSAKEYCNRVLDIDADNQAANNFMEEIADIIELSKTCERICSDMSYFIHMDEPPYDYLYPKSVAYNQLSQRIFLKLNFEKKCYCQYIDKYGKSLGPTFTGIVIFFLLKNDLERVKLFISENFQLDLNFYVTGARKRNILNNAFKTFIDNKELLELAKVNLEEKDDFLIQSIKAGTFNGAKFALLCGANPHQTVGKYSLVKFSKKNYMSDIAKLLINEYGVSK